MSNTSIAVAGSDVRLPREARDAVSRHRSVEVRSHGKPAFFVLHAEDYALVEPLLDRHRQGLSIPVTDLLTDDDFAVLAEERERDRGLDVGIMATWHD